MPVSPFHATAVRRQDIEYAIQKMDLDGQMGRLVGGEVLAAIDVNAANGKYGLIDRGYLTQAAETSRLAGSYGRGSYKYGETNFDTEEHGWEVPVDAKQSKIVGDIFDAEMVAAKIARRTVLVNREIRTAAAVFNATTFTATTGAVTNEWDDAPNATPVDDVKTAINALYAAGGVEANALVINFKVFNNLRNCASVIDRLKHNGQWNPGTQVGAAAIAEMMGLKRIIVGGALKNSASAPGSFTGAPIWSDEYAMVCRVAESDDPVENCIGRTLHWGADGSVVGGLLEQYYEENQRATVIRCREQTDEVILDVYSGYLLSNITT